MPKVTWFTEIYLFLSLDQLAIPFLPTQKLSLR